MPENVKKIFYALDDAQEEMMALDMMIQGYLYAKSQDTATEEMAEILRSKSFALVSRFDDIKELCGMTESKED